MISYLQLIPKRVQERKRKKKGKEKIKEKAGVRPTDALMTWNMPRFWCFATISNNHSWRAYYEADTLLKERKNWGGKRDGKNRCRKMLHMGGSR